MHNRKHITRTLKTSFLVNFNIKEHGFIQVVQPNIGKFIKNFVFNNICSSIIICTTKYMKNLLQNLCLQTHVIVLQAKYYKQCSHSSSNTIDLCMQSSMLLCYRYAYGCTYKQKQGSSKNIKVCCMTKEAHQRDLLYKITMFLGIYNKRRTRS